MNNMHGVTSWSDFSGLLFYSPFPPIPFLPPFLILKWLINSYQEQHHQTENESTPSVGVPASVIVSSNSITAPAPVHDSQLTDSWVGQSKSPSPGPSHITAVVKQVEKKCPFMSIPTHLLLLRPPHFLGNLTFPHHCSVLLFCIKHYSHCSSLCLCNYLSSKFTYLPAASVFHTLLDVLMLDRSSCICFVSLTVHICRMLN